MSSNTPSGHQPTEATPASCCWGISALVRFGVVAVLLLEVIQIRPRPRQVILGGDRGLGLASRYGLLGMSQLAGQLIRFIRGGLSTRLSRAPVFVTSRVTGGKHGCVRNASAAESAFLPFLEPDLALTSVSAEFCVALAFSASWAAASSNSFLSFGVRLAGLLTEFVLAHLLSPSSSSSMTSASITSSSSVEAVFRFRSSTGPPAPTRFPARGRTEPVQWLGPFSLQFAHRSLDKLRCLHLR
ncbi:Uncharacterised protein [Mobiluncus curtisii]|uniref:Uncharacterized protein n=1 Tax=Mobiluncus curtisii TaxID=2051 RepID=A0A2X3DU04_9ACTO|nr:Uncharacterised protein [Mobiluncus curtisii]